MKENVEHHIDEEEQEMFDELEELGVRMQARQDQLMSTVG